MSGPRKSLHRWRDLEVGGWSIAIRSAVRGYARHAEHGAELFACGAFILAVAMYAAWSISVLWAMEAFGAIMDEGRDTFDPTCD